MLFLYIYISYLKKYLFQLVNKSDKRPIDLHYQELIESTRAQWEEEDKADIEKLVEKFPSAKEAILSLTSAGEGDEEEEDDE